MQEVIVGKVCGHGTAFFNDIVMRRLLNLHFVGQESCCEYDHESNEIKPIVHPNIDKVKESHYNIISNYKLEFEADLTDTGRLINFRVI
jgi:hypothetical protein